MGWKIGMGGRVMARTMGNGPKMQNGLQNGGLIMRYVRTSFG